MIKKISPFALAVLTLVSMPVAVIADDASVETQIIDTMNKLFGVHPGFRANHSKGLVTEGHFKASPEAASLSKAAIFDGSSIPVTVRFSDSTGVPNIPDGKSNANPHGLSIKYHLPDGSETDMVINSLHFFSGRHGRGFPEPLASECRKPGGGAKADQARTIHRGPSECAESSSFGKDAG